MKKPSLQASLAQLEDQIAQYKKFDQEYQSRIASEKSALATSHKDALEKLKEASFAEAKVEAKQAEKENLLVLSKFLRAAAAKRQNGDDTSSENRAFEGALLLVYGGDAGAVVAMEKLIEGSEDKVPSVDQEPLDFTCTSLLTLSHFWCIFTDTAYYRQSGQASVIRTRSLRGRGSLGRGGRSVRTGHPWHRRKSSTSGD